MDDSNLPTSTSSDQPWQQPTNSLQSWGGETREVREARQRLVPASPEQVIRSLTGALILVAPAGFTPGDRKAWLTAAAMTLEGIPFDLLERGVAAARRTADHPSRIIGAIFDEIGEGWQNRKVNLSRATENATPKLPDPAKRDFVPCSPEQAAAIMDEYGLGTESRQTLKRHIGPPRKPTREDYIAMGVDPALLDRNELP